MVGEAEGGEACVKGMVGKGGRGEGQLELTKDDLLQIFEVGGGVGGVGEGGAGWLGEGSSS